MTRKRATRWTIAALVGVTLGVVAGLGKHGQARGVQGAAGDKPTYVESLTAEMRPVRVAPGQTATLTLTLEVASGFHINANKPDDPNLIPTEVTVSAPKGAAFTVGAPRFPSAQTLTVGYSEKPVKIYEGTTTITVPVSFKKTAVAGKVTVGGEIHLQGCNATACFPPATLRFAAPLTLVKGSASEKVLPTKGKP